MKGGTPEGQSVFEYFVWGSLIAEQLQIKINYSFTQKTLLVKRTMIGNMLFVTIL